MFDHLIVYACAFQQISASVTRPWIVIEVPPSQNVFAIDCKCSPRTVEIRRTVGEHLRTFSFIERRAGLHII